jgi:hypothetical protein
MRASVIIAGGAIALGLVGGSVYVFQSTANGDPVARASSSRTVSRDSQQRPSHERLAGPTERHQDMRPTGARESGAASDMSQGDSDLVMTDVAALGVEPWVGDRYELAFQYEGPRLTKQELDVKQGRFTEATAAAREDELVAAFPEMAQQVEAARAQRVLDAQRLSRTSLTPEQEAAQGGVELEF